MGRQRRGFFPTRSAAATVGAAVVVVAAAAGCHPQDLRCLAAVERASPARARCSRRLRVALVGAGAFAIKAHLPSLQKDAADCFELVAVWSRSQASARAAALAAATLAPHGLPPQPLWGEDGWLRLLSNEIRTEIFDVVLPFPSQPDFVQAALAGGFAVISEKPVAATSDRGRQLLASGPRDRWFVCENWRSEPSFRIAAAALRLGAIGRLVAFGADALADLPVDHPMLGPATWRGAGTGSDLIVDVGVHMVAALRVALGGGGVLEVRGAVFGDAMEAQSPDALQKTFAAVLAWGPTGTPGTLLFSLAAARTGPKTVPGLSDLDLRLIGRNGSLLVTRSSVRLVDREGLPLAELRELDDPSVALGLRAAALAALGEAGMEVRQRVAAEEALEDLLVLEAAWNTARAAAVGPVRPAPSTGRADL